MTSAELIAVAKKQPIGVTCGLICLVSVALIYFRDSKIDENQADYEARSADLSKIVANVRNSEKLAAQVAELQALGKDMHSRLVRASQLAVNLQYFYKLEAETEVKLVDVRQGPLPRGLKTAYTPIPFNVSVQGSYKQVMDFLQKLETGPHFCRFNGVSFSKAGGGNADSARTGGGDPTAMTLVLTLDLLGVP